MTTRKVSLKSRDLPKSWLWQKKSSYNCYEKKGSLAVETDLGCCYHFIMNDPEFVSYFNI